MKFIYKSFLTFIGFLILFLLGLGILYFAYYKISNSSDIEVNGNLSINYIDGKKFDINEKKTIKFSVSNSGDKVIYYTINFKHVKGEGSYKIYYNDEVVTEGDLKKSIATNTHDISIDAGETKLYTLELINTSDYLKGILNIYVQESKALTFADTILNNNDISTDPLTTPGIEPAIEDEGLIKSSDDIGVTYYFRGNVLNNYVLFGNKLWRIVRINGDGTVRIILNDASNVSSYYTAENSNLNFIDSNMNAFLENWLQSELEGYIDYIANAKFCSDTAHDENYNYYAYTRIVVNKIPTFNCLGTSYSNEIGILTVDEVIMAGADVEKENKSYYLYKDDITNAWYTMSAAKGNSTNTNMFMVNSDGVLKTDINGSLYRQVRPVINLIKNIKMTGLGTIDDPYRLVD